MPVNSSTQSSGARSGKSGAGKPAGAQAADRADRADGADRERNVDVTRDGEANREPQQRVSTPRGASQGAGQQPSPFTFMRRFGEEMDRLFADFGFTPLGADPFTLLIPVSDDVYANGPALGAGGSTTTGSGGAQLAPRRASALASSGSWLPQVEVSARDDAVVVRADLPGVKREDVQIEVDDGRLLLRGTRQQANEERGDGFYHSERSYGSFARAIPLPRGVDAEACDAKYEDGVLEITIPLPKQSSRAKRIQIR